MRAQGLGVWGWRFTLPDLGSKGVFDVWTGMLGFSRSPQSCDGDEHQILLIRQSKEANPRRSGISENSKELPKKQ